MYQHELEKKDFIIKLTLAGCEEECWRRFRVPATISLAALHDQVLVPVMGWARGYHGYVFAEPKNGSIFGPKNNDGYIDMMHVGMHFHDIMDDVKVPLGTILRHEGDTCQYTYDLGDQYEHILCVEAIVDSVSNSDSDSDSGSGGVAVVELLGGYGACPPEDSNGLEEKGCRGYRDFLDTYKKNPRSSQMKTALAEASGSVNYRNNWLTGQSMRFTPENFDLPLHRAMLEAMLSGPRIKKPSRFTAGTNPLNDFEEDFSCCAHCSNSVKALSKCSACRKVVYCGPECQKLAWKEHKVLCKLLKKK